MPWLFWLRHLFWSVNDLGHHGWLLWQAETPKRPVSNLQSAASLALCLWNWRYHSLPSWTKLDKALRITGCSAKFPLKFPTRSLSRQTCLTIWPRRVSKRIILWNFQQPRATAILVETPFLVSERPWASWLVALASRNAKTPSVKLAERGQSCSVPLELKIP